MSENNFSVQISNDHNEATVVLDATNTSALNAGHVLAHLSPRQARRIAQQLLRAADEADDQAAYLAARAAV